MPRFILHHAGAYNEWTTVADGPCWESALTLGQLEQVAETLPDRLIRAHATGCSGVGWSLADCAEIAEMTLPDFINKYLTLPQA